jgi:hypothetical protein
MATTPHVCFNYRRPPPEPIEGALRAPPPADAALLDGIGAGAPAADGWAAEAFPAVLVAPFGWPNPLADPGPADAAGVIPPRSPILAVAPPPAAPPCAISTGARTGSAPALLRAPDIPCALPLATEAGGWNLGSGESCPFREATVGNVPPIVRPIGA